METMQTIKDRRAVRSFTQDLVAKEQVEVLIDAATWAPSDLNRQPWSFVVMQGADQLADLEEKARAGWLGTSDRTSALGLDPETVSAVQAMFESGFSLFHGASTVILVMAPDGDEMAFLDAALASQNLMLAAHDMGLGTCPVALTHAYFSDPETRKELGLPDGKRLVLAIVVGVPAPNLPRRPLRREPSVSWL